MDAKSTQCCCWHICYVCGRPIKPGSIAVYIGGNVYRHSYHRQTSILAAGNGKYRAYRTSAPMKERVEHYDYHIHGERD